MYLLTQEGNDIRSATDEGNGKIYTSANLLPRKQPPLSTEYDDGWTHETPRTFSEWRGLFVLPGMEPRFLGGPVRSLVTKPPTQSVVQRSNNVITLIRTGAQCHVRQILM